MPRTRQLHDADNNRRPRLSLVELLIRSPLKGLALDLVRDKDTGRSIDLGADVTDTGG